MNRWACVLMAVTLASGTGAWSGPAATVSSRDLSGTWSLNRELSAFPREIGFDPDYQDGGTQVRAPRYRPAGGGNRAGRRAGGGGSAGVPGLASHLESEEDSRKIQQLVREAKNPPEHLTITSTKDAVTIEDDEGSMRTFRASGREETVRLEAGPIGVVTKWESTGLVIRYRVEKDREVRYNLSREASTGRLLVDVQFAERDKGEVIRRAYDVAGPG